MTNERKKLKIINGGIMRNNTHTENRSITVNKFTSKIIVAILSLSLLVTIGGCTTRTQGQEFCYETIIVRLTEEASNATALAEHVFTPADFPEVALSSVEILDRPSPTNPNGRIVLTLTLETPGRRNVLRAVDTLSKRSDVYRASLNYFATHA